MTLTLEPFWNFGFFNGKKVETVFFAHLILNTTHLFIYSFIRYAEAALEHNDYDNVKWLISKTEDFYCELTAPAPES